MGAEIDRLEVQVEAQATKANNQLDKLVGKLDSLSNSLSHINSSGLSGLSSGISKFAQASSLLSNVKTVDFTRLIKNISSLSSVNTQQIFNTASSIVTLSNAINKLGGASGNSSQVVDIANGIGRLGSASVQRAITNLPALAAAMNNLMTTLSKAPSVNRNIIDMTNALANLASQVNRVGSSGNSIVNGMNRTGSAMARTKKQTLSLAAAFGKFYASWWLVIRGASKLWDSIENSMNYIEVLNYFDAAFGQVAESAVSQWKDAGYSSAEAYYNSFSSRAKELTSKMTGFNLNNDGTLTATGNASLGINPTKLMNYQATFAQMSSSIGVASETSLLLSQALTEIGADLASVKNMDFDKVWKDMASGLAGMSRTLDKYGVNIRNVNLQQKLFDLGINENITNLNQNDKALLRAIILLDSTKYAWGDLADTLNQPANQLRLLESNFSNLSRTIGNLFLPMVSKVLPYVNGLVIGLQRLFTWVGSLLGIDLSGITSAVGDSAVDIGELVGETDDLTGSLEEASKAADKLKKGIRGFDELEVITTQPDSNNTLSSGGLQSGLLDEAFINSFSEYQKVWDEAFANMENRANEFADRVEDFLQPVRDIIEDFAIGDFFKAGQDTSNLVSGIFNFFADAIDNVDWYAIGDDIGDYLAGIDWEDVISSAFKLSFNIWQAIADVWLGAFKTAPFETAFITAISAMKFFGLGGVLKNKIIAAIPKNLLLTDAISISVPIALIAKTTTEEGAKDFLDTFEKEIEEWSKEDWANAILRTAGNSVGLEGEVFSKNTLRKDLMDSMPSPEDFKTIEDYKEALNKYMRDNADLMNKYNLSFSEITEDFDIDKAIEEMDVWGNIAKWWENDIVPWWESSWSELMDNMIYAFDQGWIAFVGWWKGTAISEWWSNDVKPWFEKEKWQNLLYGIRLAFDSIFTGIKNLTKGILNDILGFAEKMVNSVIYAVDVIGTALSGINFEIPGIGSLSVDIPLLEPITIPKLATGAVIPPNAPFMAMLGDQRNGTNLEAPESLIRQIIREEVSSYNNEVMSLLSEIAQNTKVTADKDFVISNETIGKGAKQYAIEYYNRTGNPAY